MQTGEKRMLLYTQFHGGGTYMYICRKFSNLLFMLSLLRIYFLSKFKLKVLKWKRFSSFSLCLNRTKRIQLKVFHINKHTFICICCLSLWFSSTFFSKELHIRIYSIYYIRMCGFVVEFSKALS